MRNLFSVLQNSSQSSELGSREVLVHLHLSSCKSVQENVAEYLRFILWTALSYSICIPHLFLCWKHFSQVSVRFHASYTCIPHRAGRKPHYNFKSVPKLHGDLRSSLLWPCQSCEPAERFPAFSCGLHLLHPFGVTHLFPLCLCYWWHAASEGFCGDWNSTVSPSVYILGCSVRGLVPSDLREQR